MAGPMPGLLSLVEELYGRMNKERLFGGGVRGAATRGLLGADAPENATPAEMETYRNIANASMALAAGPVAAVKAAKGAKAASSASKFLDVNDPKTYQAVKKELEAAGNRIYPQSVELEIARRNGVKIGLPETNTGIDRARATGYKESGYSGTNKDFRSYDASQAAGSGSGSREGPLGAWLADDPRVAQSFAEFSSRGQGGDVIYPLMIRGDRAYEPTSYAEIKEILDANTKFVRPPYRMMQDKIDYEAAKKALESKGDYVALRNTMTDAIDKPITQYLVPNTSRLRSRFAAFDPARIDEKDLLASLAAMGITLPLTMGLLSEQTD